MMNRLIKYLILSNLFYIGMANAFEIAGDVLQIDEVLPLFNVHEKKNYISSNEKGINPKPIIVPDTVKLGKIDRTIKIHGFIGETVFKDILIKTNKARLDINVEVGDISTPEIKIIPRIVTNWYQAGASTSQKKNSGQLTYELLLSNDRDFIINDRWVKSKKGGWIYEPPDVKLEDTLKTSIEPDAYKRVLLKVSLGYDVPSGTYETHLKITTYGSGEKLSVVVPIIIQVKPVKLSDGIRDKYKLLLYTAFKLGDQTERHGAYVNAMRFQGDDANRERLFYAYLDDISAHGFNGITIRDWDPVYLSKTLKMARSADLEHVILHASTPIKRKLKKNGESIVSNQVKEIFEQNDFELYYYGYDERGGNKSLEKQLRLNEKIHTVGGKSVNAIFWDDFTSIVKKTNKELQCFNIVAHSMSSHGNKEMYKSLPLEDKSYLCLNRPAEYLSYWHPHVENPVINRLFAGFWLWASGLDGVIPHGYYFPTHIEKFLSVDDLKKGVSHIASPYDDWSPWLPGKKRLRHHNSVYPSRNGPVGTLQWEGVLSGVMDLKYIITLEERINNPDVDKNYKIKVQTLLKTIRTDVLKTSSPYMNDRKSIKYLKKLERWKKEISDLLLE